jgi:disulfide bond formation protein DsbB
VALDVLFAGSGDFSRRGSVMRRVSALALMMVTAAGLSVLAGCGGGGGAPEGGVDVAAGGKLFRQTCSTCHGMKGEGIDKLGKTLIGNEFVALQSDQALVQFLIEGRPATHPDNTRGVDMPPRGGNPNLTEQDLASIIAYVRTLK